MIGKLLIDKKFYKGNAKDDYEEDPNLKFETGKEFCENYLTDDAIILGRNWFGLPSVEEMLGDIEKKHPTPKKIRVGKDYPMLMDGEIIVKVED